jgi:phosphonatase-like hydrolase
MIRMIVFDMAGTTVNENNVVYKTLHKTLQVAGYDFTLEQVLTEGAGKEKLQAVKDIIRSGHNQDPLDDAIASLIYQKFIALLTEAYDTLDISPQAGAAELFSSLRERSVYSVLNTGYDLKTALQIMTKLDWIEGRDVDKLVTASHVKHNRPKPDMIYYAMHQLGVDQANEVVKVGDSIIDVEEGKNAGCLFTVGITTGAHTRAQLESAQPDFVVDNLLELLPVLNSAMSLPQRP